MARSARFDFIDSLKGFLILTVVLGHCIQWCDTDFDNNYLFRLIYSFHMPLFILISGYLGYKTALPHGLLGKRAIQLLIPFFAWGMLSWSWTGFVSFDWILKPDIGLWFLWVLLIINILIVIVEKTAESLHIHEIYVMIFCCLILAAIHLLLKISILGLDLVYWYFPFFCIGWGFRKYDVFDKIPVWGWVSVSCLFILSTLFWTRSGTPLFMNDGCNAIIGIVYKFSSGMLGCVSIFILFSKLAPKIVLQKMGG